MRRFGKEQAEKLQQVLARAHEVQAVPPFPSEWIDSVMGDVRRQPSLERTPIEVPRLVWRAAAVVVLGSALFVGSVLTWNAGRADTEYSALFAEVTVDPTLLTGEP